MSEVPLQIEAGAMVPNSCKPNAAAFSYFTGLRTKDNNTSSQSLMLLHNAADSRKENSS